MKKIILVSAIALFSFSFTQAQELTLGIKGGVNLASIGGDFKSTADQDEDIKGRFGFHLGGIAEYMISDQFGIQGELLYSLAGSKSESSFSEDGFSVSGTDEIKLSYLSIPVMGKYFVTDEIALEAGPTFGLLLSATNDFEFSESGDGESFSESGSVDIKNDTNGLDLGLGIGGSYNTEGGLFFGLRYNLGFSSVFTQVSGAPKFTSPNNIFQISAGYKFL